MGILNANKVAPKLWVGPAPPQGVDIKAEGFDVAVLCAQNWQPPDAQFPGGVEILRFPFQDTLTPGPSDIRSALDAANATCERVVAGKCVLVTCMAGKNRSGLVCALVLTALYTGSPQKSLQQLRLARPGALDNMAFENIVLQATPRRAASS